MATTINAFAYSYLDQRIRIKAILETQPSAVFFPFFTACWLIPKSKAKTYLNGSYKTGEFYKVKENEYATKCLDEFLEGATRFYAQQHADAEMGFVVFDDQYVLDPDTPDVLTEYEDTPQKNRLETMTSMMGAIGRNAIYVGVAETDPKRYNMMMDDFRQVDTLLSYLKCKVRNSLVSTQEEIQDWIDDFKAYGGTLVAINEAKAPEEKDVLSFKNRPDFVIGGALLNAYKPTGSDRTYPVGMGLDGTIVVLTDKDVSLNKEKAMLDTITKQYLTYFQVRADDPTEYLCAGGGVYYQGTEVPCNMFLLAKYTEYLLKTNLFTFQLQNKSGVANVSIYRKAVTATMTSVESYVGFLLDSAVSQSYTQAQINESVVDKVVKLDRCITMTTLPTILFTEATFTMVIQ